MLAPRLLLLLRVRGDTRGDQALATNTGSASLFQDLLYYYSHGQLYCGRHFALKMDIPRCAACDELIFSVEFTAAEERFWHLKHFCCWVCDTPLAGHKYIPVEGMPHCLGCWQSHHGKTCHTCHGIIHPQVSRQVDITCLTLIHPIPVSGQESVSGRAALAHEARVFQVRRVRPQPDGGQDVHEAGDAPLQLQVRGAAGQSA